MPTSRGSSAVIADPDNFQCSPYAQPAPLDLTSKSGLQLYTDVQEALKVPFNGKAANVQPFLNSLAVEVKKFGLDSAVEVRNVAGNTINLHRSTVYINRRKDRITIEHTNDLPDPEDLKSSSTSKKVLTKTWNQQYKQVDSNENQRKKVRFRLILAASNWVFPGKINPTVFEEPSCGAWICVLRFWFVVLLR